MKVFIDDLRLPHEVTWECISYKDDDWLVIRTDKEFYRFMKDYDLSKIDIISFDHDIQCFDDVGIETTGYNLLQTFILHCIDNNICLPPTVIFHTQNVVGKANMYAYYVNAIKHCPTLLNIPREGEPVLAKIKYLNSLGNSSWYEVVYHNGEEWRSYEDSKTFSRGEQVVVWKYVTHCL